MTRGRSAGRPRACATAVAFVVASALTIAGVPATSGAADAAIAAPGGTATPLEWRRCGGLQCASLTVPLDHADPTGATVDVAVARVPARTPRRRVGVLVVNPGGPGAPGVARLEDLAAALPQTLRDRFDVVSFDPRGTGGTMPVDCVDSLDEVFDTSFSPDGDAERDALTRTLDRVADACAARHGTRLGQVSTVDTARDLDRLREALGEPSINVLGYSYGTYLGALHAALFPGRSRALVLDGAIDPTASSTASAMLQVLGFERALDRFLADCGARRDCAFHRDGDPARAYDRLRRRVARAPVTASRAPGRVLNDTRFDAAVLQLLYGGRSGWASLARALDAADRGDGSLLLAVADRFVGRVPDGRDDGLVEAFWAISCVDAPSPDPDALAARAADEAPRLGAFVVRFSAICAQWPAPPVVPPAVTGAAPGALVIGTRRDPATPLVSARELAVQLGGASLLVVGGDRHTSVGAGNACVDDAVTRYLVRGRADDLPERC